MKKLSLRLRLTILTAIILIIAGIALTVSASFLVAFLFRFDEIPEYQQENIVIRERRFNYVSFGIMGGVIILGTVATYFFAGLALKPATDLSKEIQSRSDDDLFSPVDYFNSNDEVSRIAQSFNSLLSRLEEAYNKQKRFAAAAAHELRTPLTSIIAAIEVLKIDNSNDLTEHKEVLDDVLNSANRLNLLVESLLKLNQTNDIEYQDFKVQEFFDSIVNELSKDIMTKNIKVDLDIEDIVLSGEKELLRRAIFNVVHNAIRYNKEKGSVSVSIKQVAEGEIECVRIIIEDTGLGIPKDDLSKVFEPFYCVDKSRSRISGGCGLGLSIVKTIIEKHNGIVNIDSKINEYTKVKILLPM